MWGFNGLEVHTYSGSVTVRKFISISRSSVLFLLVFPLLHRRDFIDIFSHPFRLSYMFLSNP